MKFPGARPKDKDIKVPTPDDFTAGAVQRAVLADTIQNPLTLAPLGLAGIALFSMALLGPSRLGFVTCFLGALTGICSWVINYFIRGETLVKRHVENLLELRRRGTVAEVQSVRAQFAQSGFREGEEAATELDAAYDKIREFLRRKVTSSNLNAQRYIALVEDVYREGVHTLTRAQAIFEALEDIDYAKLSLEIAGWKAELEALEGNEAESAQDDMRSLQRRIEGHQRRLSTYEDRRQTLRELLDQCEELEGTLETAYLDVADVIDTDANTFFQSDAGTRLEQAISTARRVEERLRGDDTSEEDAMYREAGQRIQSNGGQNHG